jgi:hypothetical protein
VLTGINGCARYLMPEPADDFSFTGAPEDYPDEWVEATRNGTIRLRSDRRPYAAQSLTVDAAGTIGTTGRRTWFLPGKFRLCPACGDQPAVQAREINKLASLSAEGRSSATTLLVSSALRWMNCNSAALPPERRKLLAFTDNRQDAALQAGHFNDFLFVSLLRAATLAAARAAGPGGLSEDEFGGRLQAQANEQIALLERGTATGGSDFSTYRYLATEGFLPGYNFPRLPLYASRPTRPGRSAQPARSAAHSWGGSAACCACRRH